MRIGLAKEQGAACARPEPGKPADQGEGSDAGLPHRGTLPPVLDDETTTGPKVRDVGSFS